MNEGRRVASTSALVQPAVLARTSAQGAAARQRQAAQVQLGRGSWLSVSRRSAAGPA